LEGPTLTLPAILPQISPVHQGLACRSGCDIRLISVIHKRRLLDF